MRASLEGLPPMEFFLGMAENNFGAGEVMRQLVLHAKDKVVPTLQAMDAMNMRGSQIWVAYKDYCNYDVLRLIECVESRDPKMIQMVNERCGRQHAAVANPPPSKT